MLKEPETMDDLLFHTRRTIDNGRITAWVWRPICPACKKGRLGKPINAKTGKVIKKAEEYACPKCQKTFSLEETEGVSELEVLYTCPYCAKSGESKTPYKRKTWQGVPAFVFDCQFCKKQIGITKKMKAPKKKKGAEEEIPDEE